ncbi:MAG: hypothetical protein JXR26_06495 [Balneolaceae bacterium]|nr:hypothetical protein [Balneolaceae bacterium]
MNPIFKGVILFFGGLLILLIVLQILVSLFADDYVANRLKEEVRKSSDNTYTIDFDDFDLGVFTGSATISNLRINADTAAFSDTIAANKPAKILFGGTVGELDISGINVFSAVWGDELHISSITLSRPYIRARRNPGTIPEDTTKQFSSVDSTIYAAISKKYKTLEIGEIDINEGHGIFTKRTDTLSALGKLNLNLQNIRVDSASAKSGRTFFTDDISIEAGGFMFKLSDSVNTVRFDALQISSDDQTIAMDSLQLIPRYPRFEYSRRYGTKKDRINLDIPKVRFEGVDFSRFIDSARIYAQYGTIDNARLHDFLNRSARSGPPKPRTLPFVMFRDLGQKIKIDSLKINNAFISYSEYIGETPRPGKITFEQLNASLYDISNYPDDIQQGITTVMDARTRVMGNGLLNAHFEFPMDSENGFHKINGRLSSMPITDFNRMIEYVAFVRIDTGMLNSLKFDMTLNKERSNGTLIMKYENFKISVLDKKSITQKGLLENLMTFVANNFVVRKNNTPESGMQAGRIQFERVEDKSIFNFWWKSLLSGIKESIKK